MLEKIKNFFQSIAGGIASIWNSIKNLWSSKPQKNSVIELVKGESNDWGVIKENGNKQLVLHISNKNMSEVMDWRNINCNDSSKYHINVKRDKAMFKIAYSKLVVTNSNSSSFIVDSVDDGKTLSCELEGMKKMLGLNSKSTVGNIDQISQKPEIASSTSKVPASDSKVLSSEEPSKFINNPSKEQLMKSKLIIPTF
ncbi:hypothetical protein HGO53_06395 [Wolbachia endosymbiont of Diaphorina citri]|jgi:hypothetical protein|uniref:hypothetical protein n=1 Tax=Wolbachia endosymbiont of Diaphorina citri TaxID=116598 RepID=UPI00155E36E4|nr:hypothetical protein [Wolbachia endosymbiont of Diaphorina citri]QJT94957.1 hypothetical protein HGO48_06540 [Wolbachia endosymbiont of Diaphorina citri]QJT96058.1 hypothetical protein HGO49_05685 [Wolbachia endosymbiont of Diaphorina citri]QJT97420.1 hypothetical protein HGO53_06395 [Wolbachia endosymbiont of Diaphorina citri]QLK11905.1 hypothetical protein FK497_06985 [Wolbachia endosymbiont of Diaphorina citri]QXY86750.1 hypothetical protein GZ064_01870 [Wolbachia endosymbiont of Diaphor